MWREDDNATIRGNFAAPFEPHHLTRKPVDFVRHIPYAFLQYMGGNRRVKK
jgi:hypothetical protein